MANAHKVAYYAEQAGHTLPVQVVKRDGRTVAFDLNRIEQAVARCYANCDSTPKVSATEITERVALAVSAQIPANELASVERVQDTVEIVLQSAGEFEAAKRYILHRADRANDRENRDVPDDIRAAFTDAAQYFPTEAQQFMFFDKYSKYNYELGRRETWIETVDRTVDFLRELSQDMLDDATYIRLREGILNMQAMPSMRMLATAGEYARSQNLALFNCSYLPVKDLEAFCEGLLISMSGCGVGFSVESYYVDSLPRIKRQKKNQDIATYVIPDSTEGWIDALRVGLTTWFNGEDIKFDDTMVRRAGLPLRRKGGRASGPGPLREMLTFCRAKILSRQGQFLRTLDAHDMMCAVGQAAVSGGVRRTAMISLFDWDDHEMRTCKDGIKLDQNPIRWNANNSAVWPEDLNQQELIQQMLDMDKGKHGEPGIFSRENAVRTKPARRKKARFGTNPCGEIILRPYQVCNLSIAVARADDTVESLKEKVELATIIGTIQSMATHFPGLREEWVKNQEEERLLGVDILGMQDSAIARDPRVQAELRDYAVSVNAAYAATLGINASAGITCNKPGGNSSQLLNTASGLHARHSKYIRRNMRVSGSSPVYRAMKEAGVPMNPENGQTTETATTWVIPFPVKSPDGAILRDDLSAVNQLDFWLQCKTNWTEHNPSCTVSYSDDELLDVIKWVWNNKDKIGGLSFLPRENPSYDQLPYEAITDVEYKEMVDAFPNVDFSKIYRYELQDMTTATSELACFAGACDV
jgi:ribonucleoside-diphosphate reductase alpha chain